jgi:hypothetical protein
MTATTVPSRAPLVRPTGLRIPRAIVLVALALLGVECALAVALVLGVDPLAVVGAHAVAALAASGWLLRPAPRRSPYAALLALATAAFGAIGPAGVLVTMVLARRHAPQATDLEVWHATLFPPGADGAREDVWRRVGERARDRARARDITPFHDILHFGSVQERQATIAVIAQKFDPAFAPMLKAAPSDEHNVVRVQAATAIARLEHQLFEQTLELEAALERAPADPGAMLALAKHNDDQAFAGLFDPAREGRCRIQAAGLYGRYLTACPHDADTELWLARLLLRAGRPFDALPRLRHLVATDHPTAELWEMECLFALGRYDDLRRSARAWRRRANRPVLSEVEATVGFWADPGAVA